MSERHALDRFGFLISPLTFPHVPDTLICEVNPYSGVVEIVAALSSDITPTNIRNLSRWLYLLARQSSGARPIRSPVVFRPITVDATSEIFTRCLDEVGTETYPYDSSDQLPPGCYTLMCSDGRIYGYPFGRTIPRKTFIMTHFAWDVPDHHEAAADRMQNPVPDYLAIQARKRDQGRCCFTGVQSDTVTWVIPPLLCRVTPPPKFTREQCHSLENVYTISSSLLRAYHENWITVDPQDGYRIVAFKKFSGFTLLPHLSSPPSSGRFWHASLGWTLAVRFTGCDARFDGTSLREAEEVLELLAAEPHNMVPPLNTVGAHEAFRAFAWTRFHRSAISQETEWGVPMRLLPSSTETWSSSFRGRTAVSFDIGTQIIQTVRSIWLLVCAWWALLRCRLVWSSH